MSTIIPGHSSNCLDQIVTYPADISNRLSQHYDNVVKCVGEENVVAVCLYGSQNYNMSYENSDVDTKAFVLPTLKDLIKYNKLSKTIVGDEHGGLCDVKHINVMFENLIKQNINFVELLFTKYMIVNTKYKKMFDELLNKKEQIATMDPVKMVHAAGGMAKQKYVAFDKPFEGKLDVLAQYGYDPKQLASLYRLQYFVKEYCETRDFRHSIKPDDKYRDMIIDMKRGNMKYDEAKKEKERVMSDIDKMIEQFDTVNNNDEERKRADKNKKELEEWFDEYYLRVCYKMMFGGYAREMVER